jgi:hypothetical protein
MNMDDLRQRVATLELVKATIEDSVANLLYYDRKEDEDLPRGAIEQLVRDGHLSIDNMVEWFRRDLTRSLNDD